MIQFLAGIAVGAYMGIFIGFFGNEVLTITYKRKHEEEGETHETGDDLQLIDWDDARSCCGRRTLDSDGAYDTLCPLAGADHSAGGRD